MVVDPAGFVLTDDHVARGAQRIQVVLAATAGRATPGADGSALRVFSARGVGHDPNVDLGSGSRATGAWWSPTSPSAAPPAAPA